jgi:hypothetical protein
MSAGQLRKGRPRIILVLVLLSLCLEGRDHGLSGRFEARSLTDCDAQIGLRAVIRRKNAVKLLECRTDFVPTLLYCIGLNGLFHDCPKEHRERLLLIEESDR